MRNTKKSEGRDHRSAVAKRRTAAKTKAGTQARSPVRRAQGPGESEPHLKRTGRPTKLTPELVERVCRYIRAGNYIETAALASGITRQTLYNWLRIGNAARDDRLAYGDAENMTHLLVFLPEEELCMDFLDAMEEAMGQAETVWMDTIHEAAKTDWRAAGWRLERRTRLPSGYSACGERDQGEPENTLVGMRTREARRKEWVKKQMPYWKEMERIAAEGKMGRGEGGAAAKLQDPSSKNQNGAEGCEQKSEHCPPSPSLGENAETANAEHRTTEGQPGEREGGQKSEVGGLPARDEQKGGERPPSAETMAGPSMVEGGVGAKNADVPGAGGGLGISRPTSKPGMFLAGLALLLGLGATIGDGGSKMGEGRAKIGDGRWEMDSFAKSQNEMHGGGFEA